MSGPTTTHPRDADRPGNTNVLFVASNCPVESCRLDREKGLVALGRGTGLAIRTTDYGRGIVMKGPGTLAAVGHLRHTRCGLHVVHELSCEILYPLEVFV